MSGAQQRPVGVFVGLATLDVIQYVELAPGPDGKATSFEHAIAAGGPAANAAVTFAALGGDATLVTALGADDAAHLVRADLEAHGVRLVALHLAETPVSSITVSAAGRSIVGTDGAGQTRLTAPPAGLLEPLVAAADVLLLDGHHPTLALAAVRVAREAGVPIVVDVGRWKSVFADLAPHADHLVCSEGVRVPGSGTAAESAERLIRPGARAVVITQGAGPVLTWSLGAGDGAAGAGGGADDGAVVAGGPRTIPVVAAVPVVRAVDTLGAGDAFHGAYAHAVATGEGVPGSVARGIEVAAIRVQHRGPRRWLSHLVTVDDAAQNHPEVVQNHPAVAQNHPEVVQNHPEVVQNHPADAVTLDALVDRARALASRGHRTILGIAGAPGAGKSHVAAALAEALGPSLAVVVPMDGFHLGDALLRAWGRRDRKGAPDTFDADGYLALLRRIADQRPGDPPVLAPRFDRELEDGIAGSIAVPADVPLVITEGNYLLLPDAPWSGVPALLTESWFLAPAEDLRVERLVARHVAHGKDPAAALAWSWGPDQRNAVTISAAAARADRIYQVLDGAAPVA